MLRCLLGRHQPSGFKLWSWEYNGKPERVVDACRVCHTLYLRPATPEDGLTPLSRVVAAERYG